MLYIFQNESESRVDSAKNVLSRISKPSGSAAKTLSKLFPSVTKFDPRAECSSSSSKGNRRKFVPKYSVVDVVMLTTFQSRIPKGECRQELVDKGCIKKIQLDRHMSAAEVKSKILEEFKCEDYTLLECMKGRLCKVTDGVELTAQRAIARRGAVYLCQKHKVHVSRLAIYLKVHITTDIYCRNPRKSRSM